ncbi:MAG: GNAT family N-acetyltransferase [Chloroflexi bacterium]|nr:GNAT family N-acetyltransferase [Chloroflexota bacterium]MCL5274911.1 GNAT family N-acetyltransferase [Chloroflexota bacterium]
MDNKHYVDAIVKGSESYFRAFALADNMRHHLGDIEWILPLPNTPGPSIVYRVSLDERTANERIGELMPGLQDGTIPSYWVITPNSTPKNIVNILVSNGFKDISDPEHPELGMALDIKMIPEPPLSNPNIEVKKVVSTSEFEVWIDVVNRALHGWNMLTIEHYSSWLSRDEISFYLGYLNGIPIATISTMQDEDCASVEFVSTLKEYRNQGVATTICVKALQNLKQKGVKTVTLRSSSEAIPLYKKLGFKPYYEQILLSYRK